MSNILGCAAGFDGTGLLLEGLEGLGFGFVEVGSINPTYNYSRSFHEENIIDIKVKNKKKF